MKKKLLTALLVLVVMACVLPMAALASDGLIPLPTGVSCQGEHSWYAVTPGKTNCGDTIMVTYKCLNCIETKTESAGIQKHIWDAGAVTKAATCGVEGIRHYVCQNGCGLETDEVIPALTHNWDAGVEKIAATCTAAGTKEYKCLNTGCPLGKVVQPYDALDHDWVIKAEKAPICGEAGYTEYYCNRSGCTETKTEHHAALTHKWNDGEVVTAATCTVAGTKKYTCQNANCPLGTVTQPYELGHDWKVTAEKAPICGEAGYKTSKCQRPDCGETKTENFAALKHKWDDGVILTAATCTEAGSKFYTCQNAGCPLKNVTQAYGPLNHVWDNGTVTKAASCFADGVKTYTCQRDKTHTKTEKIPATGAHNLSAMCNVKEYHWQYCQNPGCTYTTRGNHEYSRWRVARVATEEKDGLLRKDCAYCMQHLWATYKYSDNPPTGDALVFPCAVLLFSGAALPPVLHFSRKRRNQK